MFELEEAVGLAMLLLSDSYNVNYLLLLVTVVFGSTWSFYASSLMDVNCQVFYSSYLVNSVSTCSGFLLQLQFVLEKGALMMAKHPERPFSAVVCPSTEKRFF